MILSARRTIGAKGFFDGILGGALWLYGLLIGGAFLLCAVIPALLPTLGVDKHVVLQRFPEEICVPPMVFLGWLPSLVFAILVRYVNDIKKMAQGRKPPRPPLFW